MADTIGHLYPCMQQALYQGCGCNCRDKNHSPHVRAGRNPHKVVLIITRVALAQNIELKIFST